jgi:tripartite ATP-independent transporter DctP family solute receptor
MPATATLTTDSLEMTMLTRRTLVRNTALSAAAGIPLVAILTGKAKAAEFTFKLGHSQTAMHPMHLHQAEAAKKTLSDTGGRLEVQVFPNSQLGSEPDMVSQVRNGALDSVGTSILYLEPLNPAINLSCLGYAFSDYDKVWAAWDGDYGKLMREGMAQKGITIFEKTFDNGFRQITSNVRPIQSPADLQGLKIRLPNIPIYQSCFQYLGAAPTTVNIKEVYSALRTRLADAQENPLTHVELFKFYEVQKYCSLTNHYWDGFWIIANSQSVNAIPADLREIMMKNFNEAALKQRVVMAGLMTTLRTKLADRGLVFNQPDPASFRAVLRDSGFYKHWREVCGEEAWNTLQKYTGAIG